MSTIYGTNFADDLSASAGGDTLLGWDSLNGAGDFGPAGDADNLYGGAGGDYLDGGAGNDILYGGGGANTLNGGAGDDTIYAEIAGPNHIFGGAGIDLLLFQYEATKALSFSMADPDATITLTGGTQFTGIEAISIYASRFADTITGGAYNDGMLGNDGDDLLSGAGGDDWLSGGAGLDTLYGGSGNDTFVVYDNLGGDVIYGGAGIDAVKFLQFDLCRVPQPDADCFKFFCLAGWHHRRRGRAVEL